MATAASASPTSPEPHYHSSDSDEDFKSNRSSVSAQLVASGPAWVHKSTICSSRDVTIFKLTAGRACMFLEVPATVEKQQFFQSPLPRDQIEEQQLLYKNEKDLSNDKEWLMIRKTKRVHFSKFTAPNSNLFENKLTSHEFAIYTLHGDSFSYQQIHEKKRCRSGVTISTGSISD